ncbi:MAG: HAD-IA family hydrolase [candidate division Zixibacteria bacterium]|nr:HAD-IA family hydrolase [candidate division Zixibacteria bacterium]
MMQAETKTKGVFFDLYGTLLIYGDVKAAWSDWLTGFYNALCEDGLAMSQEAFASYCDAFFSRDEPPAINNGLTVFERRILSLGTDLGLRLTAARTKHIATTIADAWHKYMSLDPEALPILMTLRRHGKRLALVSNFDHPPCVRAVLSQHRLDSLFDAVVISGDVGVKKPDPEIFAVALDATDLKGREVMYVGDTDDDVKGALAAGMMPVLIQRADQASHDATQDFRSHSDTTQNPGAGGNGRVMTITRLSELREIVR